jgi:hypothetical protein
MGLFKRRREIREKKESDFFNRKNDPEAYFTALIAVIAFFAYILYIYLKDFYFEL